MRNDLLGFHAIARADLTRRIDGDWRRFAFVYALLLPAFWSPLFATRVLPGLDFPFHLALADMIGKAGSASSPYAHLYAPRFWPPPPALPWLLLVAAAKLFSLAKALHVVVAVYVATLPLAVAALARALRASALTGLLAFPLAYNLGLHYGFLGYTLSLPLLFGALASVCFALEADGARMALRRAGLVALAFCALYGMHLETFVLGIAIAGALAVVHPASVRVRLFVVGALVPSIAVAATWASLTPFESGPSRGGFGAMMTTMLEVRRAELDGRSVGADILWRLSGLHVHLLRGFRDRIDVKASMVLGVVIAAWFAASWWWWRSPRATFDARRVLVRVVPPLVVLTAYVGLPHHFDPYEAMSISPRLAAMFALAVVSVVPLARELDSDARATVRGVGLAVTAALGIGYGMILRGRYEAYAREVDDFGAVAQAVPAGERVVGLVYGGESRVMNVESILRALPSAYVALRPAVGSMVPLRYCGMRHIPCSRLPAASALPKTNPWTPDAFDVRAAGQPFTFAIMESAPPAIAAPLVTVVARRGAWTAARIDSK